MFKSFQQEVLKELENKRHAISNPDLDGLLSLAIVQRYYPEIKLGGWYTNSNIYITDKLNKANCIGLDISFSNQFPISSISNHVEIDCTGVSCNDHISGHNYYKKSLFSTSLLLLASIDKDFINNQMTDHQIRLLMTVDSSYMGYFAHNGRYKHNIVGYLKAYGLDRVIRVLENSTNAQMQSLQREYQTRVIGCHATETPNLQIIEDSYYKTFFQDIGIDTPALSDDIQSIIFGETKEGTIEEYEQDVLQNIVLSNAMTGKNFMKWTVWVKNSVL